MTTYTFTGAVAYDRLGSSWRTAAGLRSVTVTDPTTGLLPTNLIQGGVAVTWLTADANSRYSFTCDVPGVVVDFGAGAEALYANEVPGLAVAAGGATTTAIDAHLGGDATGLVATVAGKLDTTVASSTYAPAYVVAPPSGDVTGATDLAAINAAITAANAAGGGVVVLQPGLYLIGTNILLRSNVTLRGAGMKLTTIKLVAGGNGVITNLSWPVGNPATWAVTESNMAVEDLTVDENNLPTRYGIAFKACDGVRVQRVRAQNVTYSGIVAGQCYDVTIADCQTTATGGDGIFVYDSMRFAVYGNNILDCGDFGIEIGAGSDYGLSGGTPYGGDGAVFGNTVKSATNFGICLRGFIDAAGNPNSHYVLNVVVTGNTVRDCANNISYYELVDGVTVSGNNTSMSGVQSFESSRLHADLGGTNFTSNAAGANTDITGMTVTTPNNRPKCRADIKLRLRANGSLAGTNAIHVVISPAPAAGQADTSAVKVGVAGADDAWVVPNDVILAANTAYTIKAQFYQGAVGTFTVDGGVGNTELLAVLTPLT